MIAPETNRRLKVTVSATHLLTIRWDSVHVRLSTITNRSNVSARMENISTQYHIVRIAHLSAVHVQQVME